MCYGRRRRLASGGTFARCLFPFLQFSAPERSVLLQIFADLGDLLPLARMYLTEEDWQAIGEAFSHNRDPITGMEERDYEKLFSRIADLAPAPIGLGEPWKKAVA